MKIPAVTLAIGDSYGVDITCEEGVVDMEVDKVADILKFGWSCVTETVKFGRNCEISFARFWFGLEGWKALNPTQQRVLNKYFYSSCQASFKKFL